MGLKYSINEKFFDAWSHEMAYVLGFMYADGNIKNSPYIRGKYIRFTNTDIDRIEVIKTLLESDHTIVKSFPDGNRKLKYLIRIGNAALYEALTLFGLTPNKSLSMLLPKIPDEYFSSFLLGYFDGDGCVSLEKSPKGNIKRMLVIFTCGSKEFLVSIHEYLKKELGIKGNGLYKHGSAQGIFQLRYSTRDSLLILSYMYKSSKMVHLCLQRKYAIFIEYLNTRGLIKENTTLVLEKNGLVAK